MKQWLHEQFQQHKIRTAFFCLWCLYFFLLWKDMLSLRSDGLYAGHPYVWADWSMHIGLASVIAYKPVWLWFSTYPIYAGAKITYPFLSNLISGLLLRLGVSLPLAFILPSFICSLVALICLSRFYRLILRADTLSVVAACLFLFSGGLGAFLLAGSIGIRSVLFDTTLVMTQVSQYAIETNNILSSMMIPQRAFLLGLPMGLWIMTLLVSIFLFDHHEKKRNHQRGFLLVAGLLAGLLLVSHTHTFIVVGLFSLYVFILTYRRLADWLWYGVPAVGMASVLYMVFLHGNLNASTFFSFHPGWMQSESLISWLWFWLKNWGVFGPLSLIGAILLYRRKEKKMLQLTIFFLGLFALANLLQFQPQLWDNTKIFAWAYLGLSPSVVYCLQYLWKKKHTVGKVVATSLLFFCVGSGSLDVLHNLADDTKTFRMLSPEQIEIGVWMQRHTPPESVVLTEEMVGNPISMLSGRATLVGYVGWLFNFGLPYAERLQDIESFYEDPVEGKKILQKYAITHILVTNEQRPVSNIAALRMYEKVYENGYASLYKVPSVITK